MKRTGIQLLHVDRTCIKVAIHGRKMYVPMIQWKPLRKKFGTRSKAEAYRSKVLARIND